MGDKFLTEAAATHGWVVGDRRQRRQVAIKSCPASTETIR